MIRKLLPVGLEKVGPREVVHAEEWTFPGLIAFLFGKKPAFRRVRLVMVLTDCLWMDIDRHEQVGSEESRRITVFVIAERIRREIDREAKP